MKQPITKYASCVNWPENPNDCCAKCQPTRILGQIVFGVYDDEVRRKLFELGEKLELDQAISILRTTEAASKQVSNLKQGDAIAIQALSKSSYKKDKQNPVTEDTSRNRHPSNTQANHQQNTGSNQTNNLVNNSSVHAECVNLDTDARASGINAMELVTISILPAEHESRIEISELR
jgi:hypothetical protein